MIHKRTLKSIVREKFQNLQPWNKCVSSQSSYYEEQYMFKLKKKNCMQVFLQNKISFITW